MNTQKEHNLKSINIAFEILLSRANQKNNIAFIQKEFQNRLKDYSELTLLKKLKELNLNDIEIMIFFYVVKLNIDGINLVDLMAVLTIVYGETTALKNNVKTLKKKQSIYSYHNLFIFPKYFSNDVCLVKLSSETQILLIKHQIEVLLLKNIRKTK